MKTRRILSFICILAMLCTGTAFAADYDSLIQETAKLTLNLTAGAEPEQIIGEAAMLIAQYDVASELINMGAAIQTASLKEAADSALEAASTGSPTVFELASTLVTQLSRAAAVLSGAAAPDTFWDVDREGWYYDAVMYTVSTGIFKGTGANEFAPDAEITRGMFLTIMGRMYKKDSIVYSQGYTDVDGDAWYADAVNWAKAKGILSFITGDNFYPDKPITREELVTVLRASMAAAGEDV
ncbi:MAG: S-layer homology domain-containing protein, partial [Clostridia bacterium]|nr:S-layer homology domain-containing protein [Clostridia bacterium]